MSELNITIDGGSSKRLKTAGKYCDKDILITATGGGGGGDNEVINSILNRSIATTYSNSEITTVGAYAFCGCNKMTGINLPAVTTTGNYAFSSCTALTNVNLPVFTSMGTYTFNGCTGLTEITLPSATGTGNYTFNGCTGLTKVNAKLKTLGGYTFSGCTALTSVDTSETTTVGTYAFQNCSALTEIDLPKATSVGAYAFTGASGIKHLSLPSLKTMTSNAFRGMSITSIDMPLVTNLGNNSFRNVTTLTEAIFPSATSSSSEAMRGCTNLTCVDLPVFTSFGTSTFYGCSKLEKVILRNTSKVATLGNVNSFTGTPIADGTGYIYVPASLVNSYKTTSKWSSFANQIRAIESMDAIYTIEGSSDGCYDNCLWENSPIRDYLYSGNVNSITLSTSTGTDFVLGLDSDYVSYVTVTYGDQVSVNSYVTMSNSDLSYYLDLGTNPVYITAINVTLMDGWDDYAEHYGYPPAEEKIAEVQEAVLAALPELIMPRG